MDDVLSVESDFKLTNKEKPKIKQFTKFKTIGSENTIDAQIISRGGTATNKNKIWYNIKDLTN